MATEGIFILCALACLFRTSAAATIPITCQHEGVTYQSGERILVDHWKSLICNDEGEIVLDVPNSVFDRTLFKSVLRPGNNLTLLEIFAAERLLLLYILMCTFREPQLPSTTPPITPTTTTAPIVCLFEEFTYAPGATFPNGNCSIGYCEENGDISFTSICCKYKNKYYPVNTTYYFTSCNWGTCNSNLNFEVIVQDCLPFECRNPVNVEGQCCSTCPEGWIHPCEDKGKQYKSGDIVQLDSCNAMVCTDSGLFARNPPCCTYEEQMYKSGDIVQLDSCNAMVCTDSGLFARNPPCCTYEEQMYKHNTTFQITNCITAYCDEGEVIFSSPFCCENGNDTYELETYFPIENCGNGYCNTDGSVEKIWPSCPDIENCLNKVYQEDICCFVCIEQTETPQTEPPTTVGRPQTEPPFTTETTPIEHSSTPETTTTLIAIP